MRTFIEVKEIILNKNLSEKILESDFPESGFYKVLRKNENGRYLEDLVFINKESKGNFYHFISSLPVYRKLNLEIPEEEIICKYNESEEKKHQEKHPALPNFAKADESLKFSQRKINNESLAPTAELISEGMVSADFVLEFTKILLSKK